MAANCRKQTVSKQRAINTVIVVATVLIVLAPIGARQLSGELSRWHLAAAANAIELDEGDPDESLKLARDSHADLESTHDYWLFRVKKALDADSTRLPNLIREAQGKISTASQIGFYALRHTEANGEFGITVELYEICITPRDRQNPHILNQLAYMRSLAILDLDTALADIDRALEEFPKRGAFRDTRAWVLFQMGRPLEALADVEQAIESIESRNANPWTEVVESAKELTSELQTQLFGEREKPQDLEPLPRSQVDELIWQDGVIRYHRAKILESLGRDEEAEPDWQWIREHRLPPDDRLY